MLPLAPRTLGVLQILLSGLCFGFVGIFGKNAYAQGATPGEVLSLRFAVAGVLLFIYFLVRNPSRLRLPRGERIWSVVLGVLGYAVFSYCYFRALSGLSASLTVLLLYMYPAIVPVLAHTFLKEYIPSTRRWALPLAMAGLVMLVWGDFQIHEARALIFGLGSAFFYSIYIICSRKFLKETDSIVSIAHVQLAAGLTLGAFHWRDPERLYSLMSVAWPSILGLSVICSIFAMSFFLSGLKKLRSWEASILSTAEPVTAIVLAYLLLGERLTALQGGGAVLVLAALFVVSWPSSVKS